MTTKEPEPPWLLAKADQRIAFMKEQMGTIGMALLRKQSAFIMTPLTEPAEHATPLEMKRWEHTCDNCGAYVPDTMWTGTTVRYLDFGIKVTITFGACPRCAGKEE